MEVSRYFEQLLEILKCHKRMAKYASSSEGDFKLMAWVVGGAVVGGVVGGSAGALAGCLFVSALGYVASEEYRYKFLIKTLKGLSDRDQEKIVTATQNLVRSKSIEEFRRYMDDEGNRKRFLTLVNDMR